MKSLALLNISDIHVKSGTPENEGLVLSEFIKDVKEQVQKLSYDDIYVLIGGDLVFAASDDSYKHFDETIVRKLMEVLSIDRRHFIIVPGNHDLDRSYLREIEESFMSIFNQKLKETDFNNLIQKTAQHNTLFGKFDAFERYIADTMGMKACSLSCGYYELNETWSVHTLNTAIMSCGGYKDIDDIAHLGVDTRTLYENLRKDTHKKKILLMHHPENFCMDWVKHELRKLYKTDFDLVLSGHTHDQEIFCHRNNKSDYIHCEAPQLFTDKYDEVLGYNFIEIKDDKISRIIYREWFEKRNRFRAGSAFTDAESGIEEFEAQGKETGQQTNPIEMRMQMRLRDEMEAFVGQPYIWIERYLSDDRIDQIFKLTKSNMFTETDIINNAENIRIVAPSQYGLTCYGSHFLLTLWQTKGKFGIKINADH